MPNTPNEFEQLFEKGRRLGLWKKMTDCAKAVQMDRCTLSRHINNGLPPAASTRAKKLFQQKLTKLRSYVEKRAIGVAPASADAEEGDWRQMLVQGFTGMFASVMAQVPQPVAMPPQPMAAPPPSPASVATIPAVASDWIDSVIAGSSELKNEGPNGEGLRFVLTAQSFATLATKFTQGEIQDTVEFVRTVLIPAIGEVRRRLVRSALLPDDGNRTEIMKALGRELDELFLTTEQAKEVIPFRTLELLEERRRKLADLHKQPPKK